MKTVWVIQGQSVNNAQWVVYAVCDDETSAILWIRNYKDKVCKTTGFQYESFTVERIDQ